MIEEILERLEAEADKSYHAYTVGFNPDDRAEYDAYIHATEIVQEVAKEYGNGWISVEERLPKDSRDVWVTIRTTSGECYTTDSFYDVNLGIWRVGKAVEVIAWQPKYFPPAPYQKGE